MYGDKPEDVFYYITLYNENMVQPPRPTDCATRRSCAGSTGSPRPVGRAGGAPARLVGSGPILGQVLAARDLLAEKFGVAAEVYSARRSRLAARGDRGRALEPAPPGRPRPARPARQPGAAADGGPIVAATDWLKALPDMVSRWLPTTYLSLTDGFGRSGTREDLRSLFEIDAPNIAAATMVSLARCGALPAKAAKAIAELGVDPEKADPLAL